MFTLNRLVRMEKTLVTKETRDWAFPSYAGEVSVTIDNVKVTIKANEARRSVADSMTYFVNEKKVSFKKLCAILEIK